MRATVVLASGACNLADRARVRRGRAGGHRHRSRRWTTAPRTQLDRRRRPRRRRVGDRACSSPTRSTAPGRPVTLAVGEHVRMPRTYRGRDIFWWMDATGVLDERYDEVDDLVRARNVPSPQLVGTPERTHARPQRAHGQRRRARSVALAGDQRRRGAVLRVAAQRVHARRPQAGPPARHDRRVGARRTASTSPATRIATGRPRPPRAAPLDARPASGEIRTIVWATGFRPDLLVARRAGARPQGPRPPRRRRRHRRARAVPASARPSSAAARRASSTARATTPRTSATTSPRTSPASGHGFVPM